MIVRIQFALLPRLLLASLAPWPAAAHADAAPSRARPRRAPSSTSATSGTAMWHWYKDEMAPRRSPEPTRSRRVGEPDEAAGLRARSR